MSTWIAAASATVVRRRGFLRRALYHVTYRGNDRKAVFKNDADRKLFLGILSQVIDRFHWLCHTYWEV